MSRAFKEHPRKHRRVCSQRNAGWLGTFFSCYLLAGSPVGEGVCWRKLSRGGHLPGWRRIWTTFWSLRFPACCWVRLTPLIPCRGNLSVTRKLNNIRTNYYQQRPLMAHSRRDIDFPWRRVLPNISKKMWAACRWTTLCVSACCWPAIVWKIPKHRRTDCQRVGLRVWQCVW